jgi:hypothetical protein
LKKANEAKDVLSKKDPKAKKEELDAADKLIKEKEVALKKATEEFNKAKKAFDEANKLKSNLPSASTAPS